ncbi:MAG: DUF4386 domain-containing protein [Bacteroidales bacterium]|nr:DUF4386 domain-containing protein [Bacteroidales bacterium]
MDTTINSMKNMAKIAGFGYLVIFISGFFANFFVLQSLIVPGNATETASNILGSEPLFRFGILSFIIMVIFDVVLSWALYVLFKPVMKNLSLLTAWLRLVNSTIFGIALYNLINVLNLLSGAEYLSVFDPGQLHAQVMVLLDTFNNSWLLGLVFFGLHLFGLGYLIYKSGYIPKIIGIFLTMAAIGYLTDSLAHFLLPNYSNYATLFLIIVIVPGIIGELSLTLWLLIKGINIQKLEKMAIESAL